MRFSTILMACGILAAATSADAAVLKKAPKTPASFKSICKVASKEAPSDDLYPIYYYDVDGETELYNRSCTGFNVMGYEATRDEVFGSIEQILTTDEGDIYLYNIASQLPTGTWVKAEKEGDKLSVQCPQCVGYMEDEMTWEDVPVYVIPMKVVINETTMQGTYVAADDLKYTLTINADGTITADDPDILLGICNYGTSYYDDEEAYRWLGYGDRNIKLSPVTDELVTPPADLVTETWVWSDNFEAAPVFVGIDGTALYIQGLDPNLPESWVKGDINGDKVTFASCQYFGPDFDLGYLNYFWGGKYETRYDEDGYPYDVVSRMNAVTFNYDAEKRLLTPQDEKDGYFFNSDPVELYPLYGYYNVTIGYKERNVNDAPAVPYDVFYFGDSAWFQVPNTDISGNLLNTDNLYYELIVNDEPFELTTEDYWDLEENMTLIPYNLETYDIYPWNTDHTVYLYIDEATTFGVRSVYLNEEGNYIYSEIGWAEGYEGNLTGIKDTLKGKDVVSTEWFTLDGKKISKPANGIVIRVSKCSDGSVIRQKVVVK